VVRLTDAALPVSLQHVRPSIRTLHVLGDPNLLAMGPDRLVAIVGTRDASPYGLRIATQLATAFAAAGIGVVSGLARGIDSAAHRAALEAGGKTIAVMGTGADVPYPASNRGLHAEVAISGAVISELEPGTPAGPGCFPRRNRIIAGLCKLTIVVEAAFKSGAVNTATHAMDLGRDVAAVPGPIDHPRSRGCNHLIRDGAQIITCVDDAMAMMGVSGKATGDRSQATGLNYDEERVWDALADGAASVDALRYRLGVSLRQAMGTITKLELAGLVSQDPAGEVRRRT
jgi:DNA processing protein